MDTHLEGRHAGAAIQQLDAVELSGERDPVDLAHHRAELLLQRLPVQVARGAVGGLDRQLAKACEHVAHLVEGAFPDLHQGDRVVGVSLRLAERANLRTQALRDGQASRVVGCYGNAKTSGKPAKALAEPAGNFREVPLGIDRGNVGVDPQAHFLLRLQERSRGESA